MYPGVSWRGGWSRRGGRFVSSSRGGRGSTANKWVRPKDEASSTQAEAAAPSQSEQPVQETAGRNDGGVSTSLPAATARGPILKGAAPPAGRHTWKRPRDNTAQSYPVAVKESEEGKEPVRNEERGGDHADRSNADEPVTSHASVGQKPGASSAPTKPPPDTTHSSTMTRRGAHKLVKSKEMLTTDTTRPAAQSVEPGIEQSIDKKFEGNASGSLPMRKRGRHKLVLAKDGATAMDDVKHPEEAGEDVKESVASAVDTETMKNSQALHERHGLNKLVLHDDREGNNGTGESYRRGHIESTRGRGRGRGGVMDASRRGVKRIKLNTVADGAQDDNDDDDDDAEAEPHIESAEPPQPVEGDKYTEFAYRQTSTVSQRGRGRGRAVVAKSRGRNMGLVRVEPNAATTRICPTFLRGEQCTNEKCRKRHDVPKEAATPICSFFQRHGQCLKGDTCPFRHIKVNPHATVCPSFSLLGFCEDKECVMKHIRRVKNKPAA